MTVSLSLLTFPAFHDFISRCSHTLLLGVYFISFRLQVKMVKMVKMLKIHFRLGLKQ